MAKRTKRSLDHALTRPPGQASPLQGHLNPLPRSVVRNREYQLLNGEWRFQLDSEDRGIQERWYLNHAYAATASWPGSIEDELTRAQGLAASARSWQDKIAAWYEREFTIPEAWLAAPGHLVQLTFGACSYETRVWLNGHLLRTVEGQDVHFGGYTSFSYELPPDRLLPTNRLTVRIAHSFDVEIPRGKQESRVYKRGGIWYQTITGAVRSVWIEPVERNRLRSRLTVTSRINARIAEFTLTTHVHDPGPYRLRLAIAPRGSSEPIAVDEFPLVLEAGDRRQHVAVPLPGAKLWSPAQPNLYALTAQLISPGGQVSQIEALFGLRRVEARARHVYLNDKPIYLDGILYQPGTATYEQMKAHMHAMKALGCNLVRVHIAGVDPRLYDLADEIGLLLWVEVPSPHTSSEVSRENHWAELKRMLVIIGLHPSIILCSLYNEDWGAEDIAVNAVTRAYIARTYEYMKVHYPHLLIVDNDGWQHISVEGRLKSDLLTAHLYTDDPNEWRDCLTALVNGDASVTPRPLVVGDPFFYRGQLPLIVSEWGGFGFKSYGGPPEGDARVQLIRAHKAELRKHAIAGDVYTQATSIEEEVNGLIVATAGELLVPPGILASMPPPQPARNGEKVG